MNPEKLRAYLQRLNRKELEDLSEQVLGDRNSSARNKDELVALLMAQSRSVNKALGHSDHWWDRSSTHFYGIVTLVGTLIALVAFFFPRSDGSSTTSIDPLRRQRILDQVERLRSTEPEILTEDAGGRLDVEDVPDATKTGFELIDHAVVCDLRGFKSLPSVDHLQMKSPVVQQIRQRIKKLDDSDSYLLRTHTSGIDVFSKSTSHPLTVHASDERRTVAKYPVKPRVLEFDVSEEPTGQEFDIEVTKTFWNAFQNLDQSWVGIVVELPTRSISYLVVFPDDKSFKDVEHFVNDGNGHRIELPEEEYVLQDPKKRWIWWNIVNPKPGHGYNIDWEW